jgi:hypothetical protein
VNKRFTALLLAAAFAVSSEAGTSMRKAEGPSFYRMPSGDHSKPSGEQPQDYLEVLTGIPMGVETLKALKNRSESLGIEDSETVVTEVPIAENPTAPKPNYASGACNTNIATGSAPPDIHGAVGPGQLVVVTNSDIGVYNRSNCTIVGRVSLATFFNNFTISASEYLFDPRVIYDRSVGRFFMEVESRNGSNTDQFQYFAVSTDATGATWYRYRFALSQGTAKFCKLATNSFWDYPNIGKNAKRWFITAADFLATGGARGAVMVIDKAPTLTGGTASALCFNNIANSHIAPPIVLDTSTQSVFLSAGLTAIARFNHTTGATLGADTLASAASYDIPDWSTPPDAVQPNGQKLDSLEGRFQSASIQSRDRLWNIHTVASSGRPLIRWYRLAKSTSSTLSAVTVATGASDHLFNPSFATNSGIDGSPAFITASRTIPTCLTSTCLAAMVTFSGPNNSSGDWSASIAGTSTAQFETDGLGSTCNSNSRGSCRWGDYSSTGIDPYNGARAWGFNQLINGSRMFDWFTRGAQEIYNVQYGPETGTR